MQPVARMILFMLSRCRRVTRSFRPKIRPGGHHQRDHHREAAEDGPGHEVRREDRRVPAGQLGHGEVEAHHRVDAQHQRRGQRGQEQVRPLVDVPLPGRAPPAQGEHAVGELPQRRGGPVAQRGQVGDHAQVPEQQRHRGVGAHREHVPQQRAAEVRPDRHLVRIRRQPVDEPHPAHVDRRKHAGADHGEDRHRLGRSG